MTTLPSSADHRSAASRLRARNILLTVVTYLIALAFLFPLLWMILAAFKTEAQAFATPPVFFFTPIWENFQKALPSYFPALKNSLVAAIGSTLLAFVLGLPAAFALAVYPTRRAQGVLTWMLSTKFMPAVGVIVPLFLLFRNLHLLDTLPGLILMYTTMNLPLVVWMMHSYMSEIPFAIYEAAKVDGASVGQEFFRIALPLSMPGISATALLALIFAWNEVFFAINLTNSHAAPLSVFIGSFKTSEGLFWAQLSAAATLTVLPVLIFGWIAQRQLVRGLSFGAVK
ncbi:mannitol ABC transporter membrane protein / sorbitol ABC transporter membrane protein (plasmid) [Deinococcus geothermalis DSM 11300]|uniref:Mannitol ABC transporter membrane protein / sorbitol ABC transporter membrane protein n=1 Tax=Deinococcus geothermalis (strain DSM 11300 / CIP 105573 / AG-3a) TaxID=319795 RepID=Q1J2I7_DEIGD|nr:MULTISPECIES: carbohydrate ABC transporter permease [Deinococcus]ABF44297.1 mannitol ABC transporter membrane protein / sorbitol ABC transporter membrane protein [Deinococcus geothermalis DSM 11300]MBI0446344.1 carbohydrate ABC transporter permease [Deinococcus sp. DB0503]TDE85602.1 carbohydrate ABC transporter permease [Deinococcus sp. S9]